MEPELSVELYCPETGKWKKLAWMQVPRMYHTATTLLPDARVLVTGKCGFFQGADKPPSYKNGDAYRYPEHRGEVFTPPYLLRGAPPRRP